jgi:hypothetical protein
MECWKTRSFHLQLQNVSQACTKGIYSSNCLLNKTTNNLVMSRALSNKSGPTSFLKISQLNAPQLATPPYILVQHSPSFMALVMDKTDEWRKSINAIADY